jgi:hypothetical protein
MSDRPRYYLTTSIAYANNKPGIHTLYEVIGADAIARWHRMVGHDTRFLTGTDEHSINIAQAAVDEGRPTREFVDEKVALFTAAEAALGISADRFIRTTDPDHVRAAQEMVRRAHANGDLYLGDPITGQTHLLVKSPETESGAVTSFDGTRIAFARDFAELPRPDGALVRALVNLPRGVGIRSTSSISSPHPFERAISARRIVFSAPSLKSESFVVLAPGKAVPGPATTTSKPSSGRR